MTDAVTDAVTVTRDDFLKPSKRRIKKLPMNDRLFKIQSLFDSEMISLRESFLDKKGEIVRARSKRLQQLLVARCLVDDNGTRLLSDEDVFKGAMDGTDGLVVTSLYVACKEWTGFASDGDWAAIEDASKNSEDTDSNGSTSALPSAVDAR